LKDKRATYNQFASHKNVGLQSKNRLEHQKTFKLSVNILGVSATLKVFVSANSTDDLRQKAPENHFALCV